MKLATHAELRKLTGENTPVGQYEVLRRELGITPIFVDGKVRVYQEVLVAAMLPRTTTKPGLNL